ncbi:unnamed protein product [Rhizophagus irregularis]|nr:unnamed protein product [Rhizophagus irregularis]
MNRLSTEVLEQVFRKFKDDFHASKHELSAALVNRKWCRIIVPIMWEDPFGSTDFPDKLVKILLSLLDEESRSLLTNKEIDLSKSPPFQTTTFDYACFIRSLQLDKMYDGIRNYLITNNQFDEGEELIGKYKKTGFIFHEISSLILRRSSLIEYIRSVYPYSIDYAVIVDDINLIPYMTNANKCLKYLRVVITFGGVGSVLESLSSQKDSLINLTMNTCDFDTISDDALKSLITCKKLERLVLERCIGLEKERFNSLSRSFPLLKEIIFFYKHDYNYFPDDFIIGLIQTANVNLRNLDFDFYSCRVVNAILNYMPEFDQCRFDDSNDSNEEEESSEAEND